MMDRTVPELQLPLHMLPCLSPLFQKGFRVEIETGCTLESLLCDQWELSAEYVQQRISTLFLNGKPVDDISTATVAEGAVLALSSAMPGLVGAVMRRGGFFSSLREGITYREIVRDGRTRRGIVTVKLFNHLIEELGPRFLSRGLFVNHFDLENALAEGPEKSCAGTGDIFIIAGPDQGR